MAGTGTVCDLGTRAYTVPTRHGVRVHDGLAPNKYAHLRARAIARGLSPIQSPSDNTPFFTSHGVSSRRIQLVFHQFGVSHHHPLLVNVVLSIALLPYMPPAIKLRRLTLS